MGMTRAELVQYVGERVNQWNGSNFIDGKLTKAMVQSALQNRYDELFSFVSRKYRQDFESFKTLDFGPAYDDTQEAGKYDLQTADANLVAVLWVGVKFAATDSDFTRCLPAEFNALYEQGNEKATKQEPKYLLTTVLDNTNIRNKAIEILPHATVDIEDGLYIRYIERPALLSDTQGVTDRIPSFTHWYVAEGALIDAYSILGGDYTKKVNNQFQMWLRYKDQLASDYVPQSMDKARVVKRDKHINLMRRRII